LQGDCANREGVTIIESIIKPVIQLFKSGLGMDNMFLFFSMNSLAANHVYANEIAG
jgi:hypothetical protein